MPELGGAVGRQYKSRRNRPCDLCRSRKAACVITARPPCDLCRTKGLQCTFVKGPGARRRLLSDCPSVAVAANDTNDANDTIVAATTGAYIKAEPVGERDEGDEDGECEDEFVLQAPMATDSLLDDDDDDDDDDDMSSRGALSSPKQDHPRDKTGADRSTSASPSHDHDDNKNNNNYISLENGGGRPYRFVGLAGELDAYLIARRRYDEALQSESPFTGVTYQYMKPLEMGLAEFQPPPVFTIGNVAPSDHSGPDQPEPEPEPEPDSLGRLRQRFGGLVANSLARELMRIFFRFIGPSFPVLSRRQMPASDDDDDDDDDAAVDEMPLSLLSAMCASALPFVVYDDALCVLGEAAPDAGEIYRIACEALHLERHRDARLATVQAALLVLQRPPREDLFGDAAAHWRMCAVLVADCQALGLHRNAAAGWAALAPWEVRLRTRLWWAAVVTETWTAFGQGMRSHIGDDDADVPLPTAADLLDDEGDKVEGDKVEGDKDDAPFCHLVGLTVILRDIHTAFYTVRAAQRTCRDLQASLDTSKHLFARLKRWHQALPPSLRLMQTGGSRQPWAQADMDFGACALSASGTLRLAYVVAQLALFRALLRPLAMADMAAAQQGAVPAAFWHTDGAVAIMKGALVSARELVRFIEGLTTADWDGFWHSWSKHNFALASTFLMHLLVLTNPSTNSPVGGSPGDSPDMRARPHTNSISSISSTQTRYSATSPQAEGGPATGHYLEAMHVELEALTKRWRWALRLAQRGAGGRKGLMSVSLRRTEALFREWQIGKTEAR